MSAQAPTPPPVEQSHGGIHVSRGVALRIPAGGLTLRLSDKGELDAHLSELHLQLNTCTDWLEIALDHLKTAHDAHALLMEVHSKGGESGTPLQAEFKASMQATVAAATFFEALYAATRDCLPPNRNAPRAEGRSQASRANHVTEQLKRAFGLKQQGTANLASVLSEVYRFRDEAVHPAAAFGPPALHPDLSLAVERRFAMYTASNAHLLVRAALAFCEILPKVSAKQGPKESEALSHYLLASGEPLFSAWRSRYGALQGDEGATGP